MFYDHLMYVHNYVIQILWISVLKQKTSVHQAVFTNWTTVHSTISFSIMKHLMTEQRNVQLVVTTSVIEKEDHYLYKLL